MKRILVCGAGGFIGGHLVKKLKKQGHWVRAVDIKQHEFSTSPADEFIVGDLTDQQIVKKVIAISGKNLAIKNIPVTYQGVRGRRSDNTLIKQELNWAPSQPLNKGLEKTYSWIKLQVKAGVSV
jgi:nucleoside-diphosphate-sugar epimerase